jgi:hypothetical protein
VRDDYLKWYIRRKINDQSFEDCEKTMVKLKAFFFKTPYQWTTVYDCLQLSNFLDFFFFFWLSVSFVFI